MMLSRSLECYADAVRVYYVSTMQCVCMQLCTSPLAGIRMPDLLDSLWLVHKWHLAIIGNV